MTVYQGAPLSQQGLDDAYAILTAPPHIPEIYVNIKVCSDEEGVQILKYLTERPRYDPK